MTSQMFIPIHRKILLVLTCIAITAGCAGFERQSKPAAVPIQDKVAMSLVVVPQKGIQAIQADDKNILINKNNSH